MAPGENGGEMKYKYVIKYQVHGDSGRLHVIQKHIDQMSEDGWRLVSVAHFIGDTYYYYYEKPV